MINKEIINGIEIVQNPVSKMWTCNTMNEALKVGFCGETTKEALIQKIKA